MAGRKSERDLVGLTVLALLTQGPRHAYGMLRFIAVTHKDYVQGLPRSLYHAVRKLSDSGRIAPVETVKDGNRPERTVYKITDDGRSDLVGRLKSLLETVDRDSTPTVAALSLMGALPLHEAKNSLRVRADSLRELVNEADRTLAEMAEAGLPRLPALEVEFERNRDNAELTWTEQLIEHMNTGNVTWAAELPPLPE
ncbi:PadR family transcriptional regulator [Haloglycomyces albus]|uniref:PadR family transcriptional regulator n=1 Tax=Haloglycomyces albus TaxID=526067 RepID=UPI00046CE057|nr:helix-turn-helix transcriptional regulator [Haloglycomyces albus]